VPIWKTPEEAAARMHVVSNRQVALIALAGVLVSAGLSFGSAELVSRRTTESATATIERQLNGETERSRAEFLRGQRQILYSQIIADERKLVEVEDQNEEWSNNRELLIAQSNIQRQFNQLKGHAPTVEIIASKEVGEQFAKLIDIRGQMIEQMRQGGGADMGPMRQQQDEVLSAFYRAARKDMGA
jgi:hypothetical protein